MPRPKLPPAEPLNISLESALKEAGVVEALAPLNARQRAFVLATVQNPESTQEACAIEAGYSKASAYAQASKLLKNSKIIKALQALNKAISLQVVEKTAYDKALILTRADYVYLNAMEGDDLFDKDGNWVGRKVDRRAALQALKLMGDHVDVGAFKQRHDITSGGEPLEAEKTVYVIRVGDQDIEFT